MMKTIAAVLLAAASLAAHSEEATPPVQYDLMVAGFAIHTASQYNGEKLNGVNPGLGVRISGGIIDPDGAVEVGTYRNSFKRQGIFAIYEYTPYHYGKADFGVFGGIASGYTSSENAVNPIVAGFMSNVHLTQRLGLQVRAVPGNVSFVSVNAIYNLGK